MINLKQFKRMLKSYFWNKKVWTWTVALFEYCKSCQVMLHFWTNYNSSFNEINMLLDELSMHTQY